MMKCVAPRARAQTRPFRTRPRIPGISTARAMPVAGVEQERVDVAIVGGGPCGLAIAVGLRNAAPDLKVAVLERADELRAVGFTIGLLGEREGEDVRERERERA